MPSRNVWSNQDKVVLLSTVWLILGQSVLAWKKYFSGLENTHGGPLEWSSTRRQPTQEPGKSCVCLHRTRGGCSWCCTVRYVLFQLSNLKRTLQVRLHFLQLTKSFVASTRVNRGVLDDNGLRETSCSWDCRLPTAN
jgi:hypothetical protein